MDSYRNDQDDRDSNDPDERDIPYDRGLDSDEDDRDFDDKKE